jgi:hypothetical protein
MADYLDFRQAEQLADDLASYGQHTSSAHVARMERQCKQASRLIRAMLRQANRGDNWRLPDDE